MNQQIKRFVEFGFSCVRCKHCVNIGRKTINLKINHQCFKRLKINLRCCQRYGGIKIVDHKFRAIKNRSKCNLLNKMVKMVIETKVVEMNSSLKLVGGLWRSLDAFFSRWQAAKTWMLQGRWRTSQVVDLFISWTTRQQKVVQGAVLKNDVNV